MNSYDFEQLNEFFTIKPEGNEIFRVLKKLIDFDSAYIFFVNPLHLEYSYNPREIDIENINLIYEYGHKKLADAIYEKLAC